VAKLSWATGCEVISVRVAAGVLAVAGVVLSPRRARVPMSASSMVALNPRLLRRLKLNPAQVR
jgi:hypothetical protein